MDTNAIGTAQGVRDPYSHGVSSAWPLVGRTEELELVVARLAGNGPRSVVIGGSAGVGKTRLAREVADRLAGDGWAVERTSATVASSLLPFGALARLLPLTQDRGGGSFAAEVISITVDSLRQRSRQRPLLLLVDDAHLLDQFSALLIHHLASDGTVRLLLTIRSGEPVPDPLPGLWKDGLADRIELQPLSQEEVTSLLRLVLGAEVERGAAEALWRSTSGQPLLLHEVVVDSIATGALAAPHSVWQWRPGLGHGVRLREVVAARLGALSGPDRLAVELVSLSEPLAVVAVTALAPESDLLGLERREVLRVESDGLRQELRLWHPILAEVVRGQMSPILKQRHSEQLAAAYRSSGLRRRSDFLRVALLQLDAGDRSHVDDLARAAMEANTLPDHPLAERLARAAYASAPSAMSALALGEATLAQGKRVEAELPLRDALKLAQDDPTRARVAWDLAIIHRDVGQNDAADAVLDLAESLVEDEAWRQVIEGHRVQQLLMDGHTKEAARRGEALLARAVDGRVRLRLVTSLVPARALAGRTEAALELAAAAVPDAFQHQRDLPLGVMWTFISRAVGLLLAGELNLATTHAAMARAASDGLVRSDDFSVLGMFEGRLALACGRASDATRRLREAVARLRLWDTGGYLPWALAALAEAEAVSGDSASALVTSAEAAAAGSARGAYGGDAARALAVVSGLTGHRTAAVEQLRAVAEVQAAEGQLSLEIQTRHDAYRFGDRSQAGAILTLADAIDGAWSPTLAAHVRAVEAAVPAQLDAASVGFESQGALLLAAEAAAEAASAYRVAGLKVREAAAIRRSQDLAASCGPVFTPILVDAAAPVNLTRRERDVVELAIAGMTNAEIADRLFLSVRTVEGHLLRASAKLGVNDRGSLAKALGR